VLNKDRFAGGSCEGINEFCGCDDDGALNMFVEGACILDVYALLDSANVLLVSVRGKPRLGLRGEM
jgi:hypothetical protein